MGDLPLQRVQPGDPLKFSARSFNIFCDTAETVARMRRQFGAGPQAGRQTETTVVTIRNDTGDDLDRFSVVGLGAPIIDPTDNPAEFANRVTFIAETPDIDTHSGRFGILVEPIADGSLGRAVVSGVCQVQVAVGDTGHQFADIGDGVTANLVSAAAGPAHILWIAGTSGSQWAIIRFGVLPPEPQTVMAVVQSGHENYADGAPVLEVSVKLLDSVGEETGDAFYAYIPTAAGQDPALFPDDKVVIVLDPPGSYDGFNGPRPVVISACTDDKRHTVKLFSGSTDAIAAGWHLCDGTNGTVDLRGRFVLGLDTAEGAAADENAIGDTGGFRKHGTTENNHATHAQLSAHSDPAHSVSTVTDNAVNGIGFEALKSAGVAHVTPDWTHAAFSAHSDSDNRPPYYVLAYIERVE